MSSLARRPAVRPSAVAARVAATADAAADAAMRAERDAHYASCAPVYAPVATAPVEETETIYWDGTCAEARRMIGKNVIKCTQNPQTWKVEYENMGILRDVQDNVEVACCEVRSYLIFQHPDGTTSEYYY